MADIRARLAVLPAPSTSGSRSRTGSTTCCRACARRSRSRSSATTSTRCAAWPSRCGAAGRHPGAGRPAGREARCDPAGPGLVDYEQAAHYGVDAGACDRGARDPAQRPRRLADHRRQPALRRGAARSPTRIAPPQALRELLVETPAGRVPLLGLSRRSRTPTGRTRSSARTRGGASSSSPTPTARTWPAIVADIRSVSGRGASAAGLFHAAWRAPSRRRRRPRG